MKSYFFNNFIDNTFEACNGKLFKLKMLQGGDITKVAEGGWKMPLKSEEKINAFIMLTDPLNILQNNNFSLLGRLMPGKHQHILANRWGVNLQ